MSNDMILVGLVHDANRGKLAGPAAITLFVKGLIVSGEIVGIDEYMRLAFQHEPEKPDEAEIPHEPHFIHLKDAKIFRGGDAGMITAPGGSGVPWRGRLSSVDGFLLGRLDEAQPAEVPRFPGPRALV
jgi:hypothetical protein